MNRRANRRAFDTYAYGTASVDVFVCHLIRIRVVSMFRHCDGQCASPSFVSIASAKSAAPRAFASATASSTARYSGHLGAARLKTCAARCPLLLRVAAQKGPGHCARGGSHKGEMQREKQHRGDLELIPAQ